MRSATPIVARRAGTKLPIWAMSVEQRGLADVGALAGHVGAGDEEEGAE